MLQQEGDQPRQRIFTPRAHSLPRAPSAATFTSLRARLQDYLWQNSLAVPHLRPGAPHTDHGGITRASHWQPALSPRDRGFSALTSIWAAKPGSERMEISADHSTVVDKLLGELEVAFTSQEFWIVNVPSCSEQIAPHRAWNRAPEPDPGGSRHWVEPEYRAKLRAAYLLLASGIARYIFISGGEIDTEAAYHQPSGPIYPYIDALFGKQELLELYRSHWNSVPRAFRRDLRTPDTGVGALDPLEMRILVDPYALHTETNVRNCDRFCAHVGLDRNLIATSFGRPWSNVEGGEPPLRDDDAGRELGATGERRHDLAEPQWNYGQGDYYSGTLPGLVFHSRYLDTVNYEPGSFVRLPTNVTRFNGDCDAGEGVFGTGNIDFPEVPWISFRGALWGEARPVRSESEYESWRTGVIFHDKLNIDSLLIDQRLDDDDQPG